MSGELKVIIYACFRIRYKTVLDNLEIVESKKVGVAMEVYGVAETKRHGSVVSRKYLSTSKHYCKVNT